MGDKEDSVAWVIEHVDIPAGYADTGRRPYYFTGICSGNRTWSPEHIDAVRFARQHDAEIIMRYIGFDRRYCSAIAHKWIGCLMSMVGDVHHD